MSMHRFIRILIIPLKSESLALKKIVEIDLLSLKSVGSFYDGSNEVDRNEFTTFTTPLIKNNSSINSMQWVPRVKNSQRAAFETDARKNGLRDFKIVEIR